MAVIKFTGDSFTVRETKEELKKMIYLDAWITVKRVDYDVDSVDGHLKCVDKGKNIEVLVNSQMIKYIE